jgi:hypothetical protein
MGLAAQSQSQRDSALLPAPDSVVVLEKGKIRKQKMDSTLQLGLPDSLRVIQKGKQKIAEKHNQLQDSLVSRPKEWRQGIQSRIDTIATTISNKIADAKDSLQTKLNRSLAIGLGEQHQKAPNTLDSTGLKVLQTDNRYLTNILDKGDEKTSLDVPNVLKGKEMSKDVVGVIPPTEISKLSGELPKGADTEVIDEVKNLPAEEVLQVDEFIRLDSAFVEEKGEELASEAGVQVKEIDEVKQYAEQVKELGGADIREVDTESIEQAAGEIDQLTEVNEQAAAIDKTKSEFEKEQEIYKQELERYQNLDYIKEQVNDRHMQLGVDPFAGREELLNAAREKLHKLAKKHGSIKSVKNLPLLKRNAMRGKPFVEHLYAGMLIQLHQEPDKAVDISPFIGYKISGVWRAGLGYAYRVRLDKHDVPTHLVSNQTYGYKFFTELDVYKGLFAHVSYESMNTGIRKDFSSTDLVDRAWVEELYVGGGSSFKIKNIINGYMMTLYNVNHDLLTSPSNARVVIRVGVMLWK